MLLIDLRSTVVDLHSKILDALPPPSSQSNFLNFHEAFGKIWPNNSFAPFPFCVGAPCGKSLIRHCSTPMIDFQRL